MQPFQIFKAGTHTAASGVTLEFGEDLLRGAVVAYDPALHEAPIVVGHPKDNGPAYGWVKSLDFTEDGLLIAEPDQLDPDFAEMVAAGRFKKRSASWYLPDSPNNPKPGTLYLRHVGFLGAQPPAIKGLRDVSFGEAEEGVVEFADAMLTASLFRRLREFLLDKFTTEDADRVVPDWMVQDLEHEARQPAPEPADQVPAVSANFNEDEETPVKLTPEEIAALQAENARLKANQLPADFNEQANALAQREKALAMRELGGEIDQLVAIGKVLPAQRAGLVEFMAALPDADQVVEFGEGDQAKKQTPREFMRAFLASMPNLVDFGEHAADDKPDASQLTAQELANKAVEFRESQAAKGIEISVSEAVAAIRSGKTN